MDQFSLGKYPQSSLLVVYSERAEIELDPPYQRIGGIWTHEKRQLLLDSLLNGFDVPKLYFHEFVPPKHKGGKTYRFAIIDGKQRLQTIWDFIDGNINLSDDFTYLKDDSVKAAGLDYSTLARRFPQIKSRFDATPLDITTIRTDDIELIEDMFSRLNEAVPLNAPEKRNALGGPLPPVIRRVAGHQFFKKNVPFSDKRYRHRDLATKFLYFEHTDTLANTKKADLDAFVLQFREWRKAGNSKGSPSTVTALTKQVHEVLESMESVFAANDSLLRQVGIITVYYHLYRNVVAGHVNPVKRDMLLKFEKAREFNRSIVEASGEASPKADRQLLEFDKHSQSPNDAYAIRERLGILLGFLNKKAGIEFDSTILRRSD